MSVVAYRNLMRAARLAFQGDAHILAAAQLQIREEFRSKASMSASDEATQQAIQHAQEVAKILRENVVQGRQARSQDSTPTYKLRIHEHTERGDNDTIKFAGSGSAAGGGCGCK